MLKTIFFWKTLGETLDDDDSREGGEPLTLPSLSTVLSQLRRLCNLKLMTFELEMPAGGN